MINQWESVAELKCEYDIPLLCKKSGLTILSELKLNPVSFHTIINTP